MTEKLGDGSERGFSRLALSMRVCLSLRNMGCAVTEPGGLRRSTRRAPRSGKPRRRLLSAFRELAGEARGVLPVPDRRTTGAASIDRTGLPARAVECLGREKALACSTGVGRGDQGRRRLQDEYLEWRVVREDGTVRRVELTAELADYWRVLAAYRPRETLALIERLRARAIGSGRGRVRSR